MPRDPRGQLVEKEMLTLPVWDRFDASTGEAVARAVERCLPEPWRFVRVTWHEMGDQKRHVAFFDWNGTEFALIPGGEVTLGYDRANPFRPSPEQRRDWQRSRRDFGYPTLDRYLKERLAPLRNVLIAPALVETRYREWYPNTDDDELTDDEIDAAVNARFAEGGFRLPTADEWEYFCAAGSRTLWRWENSPQTVIDAATRLRLPLAQMPNAFGLRIADDSYHPEWVEGRCLRGGDGGAAVCGGCGALACGLVLASPFRMPEAEREMWTSWDVYDRRRVFPLPPETLG
jgi:hypothetical protein